MMKKVILISLVVFVSVAAIASYFYFFSRPAERGIESTVSRVIDGDTIQLANGDIIRLIGIDAPDKDQPYYKEVNDQLKKLEGKIIRMEKDKTNKDRYGRYLRYIFLDGHFVNLEILQNGLAYVYIVSPDKKYEKELLEAETLARTNGIGIWRRSEYSDCVNLDLLHYNAKGEDDKNLSDEFFVIKNSCAEDIIAKSWSVRNTFRSFGIPEFSMRAASKIKVISGSGRNSAEEIFLSSDRPIWNNKGDVLYIRDENGGVILSKSYKNE